MRLYEIAEAYLRLSDELIDTMDEEGAVDPDVAARFQAIEGDFKAKLSACCRMVRNLEAMEEAYKAEANRLTAKKQAAERRVSSLKAYMLDTMRTLGETKIKADDIFTVAIQQSNPSVRVDSLDAIPSIFDKVQDRQVRISDILVELKAGSVIPGVSLVRGSHVRIR